MNCGLSENQIMRYFDGDLNDIELAQLKQHLKTCEKCSEEFESLSGIFGSLKDDYTVEPPEDFEEQVMLKVNTLELERKNKSRRFSVFLYSFATLLLVALTAFLLADLRDMGTSGAAPDFSGSLDSVSGVFSALAGTVGAILSVAADMVGTFLHVAFVVIKTYYYVFVMLLAVLFAVQWMFVSLVKQNNGGTVK